MVEFIQSTFAADLYKISKFAHRITNYSNNQVITIQIGVCIMDITSILTQLVIFTITSKVMVK